VAVPAVADRAAGRPTLLERRIARALVAHEHRSAALLLGLLVLAYLWPALIQGRLLSPTALLYAEAPWQSSAPAGIARWINGDLGDVPYASYAWDVLARRLLHAGTFPAWNPYAFGGTPLWANSQIAWLSPFSVPLWLLPLNYGLGVAAALKLCSAGFGTYLLARELRLRFWAALLAGVAFALCSFNVVWLSYGVFVSVAAMLPWALWLTERIVRRGRSLDGLLLAGVLAAALTGGHPGTQVHLLAATGLYALVRAVSARELDMRSRGTRLAIVAGGLAVALLVAAVVLVPAERAAADTVGAAARAHGAPHFAGSGMPFDVARSALFPEWWGRPSEGVGAGPGPAGYRERTFYAGAVPLVLALLALLAPGAWRRKAPFALLGLLGLAIALRLPGVHDLVIRLPGFDRVQNSRIYLWFVLAVAVLGGFGLQRMLERRGRLGRGWLSLAAALLAAVAAIATIGPDGDAWAAALQHALRRTRTADATVLSLASVLTWLALAAALAGIVLLLRRRPRLGAVAGGLVALVVALDLLHAAHGYQPMGPVGSVLPKPTAAIGFLQRHRDEGRIAGIQAMSADWSTLYGLRDVRGSDAPLPTRRFFRLWRLMDPTADPYSLEALTALSPRVLGLLGARWLLLPPGSQAQLPGLRPAYEGADATIYENRLVAPRAFVARTARIVASADEEFATLGEDGFDPRRHATVRRGELGDVLPAGEGRAGGSARVTAEENATVTLQASLPRRGLVVLGDTWAPGWSVAIDGREAHAVPANAVLRGVVVPAGRHAIVWSYRVPGLRLGAVLSGLGLLAAVAWAGALTARSRRGRRR
jgi:hypothetical protein